jgi:hypothetical protein
VVITDVNGNATSNQLRAAAMRHIKQKGQGYIEIPHDPKPANQFFNLDLFPMIYPTLYPYGLSTALFFFIYSVQCSSASCHFATHKLESKSQEF